MLRLNQFFTVNPRSFCSKNLVKQSNYAPIHRSKISRISDLSDNAKSSQNLSSFFQINTESFKSTISTILHPEHTRILNLFDDRSLLIRKPLVETIQTLEQNKKAKISSGSAVIPTVPKIVFYGRPGSGISSVYAMVALYAQENEGLLFNFFNAESWLKRYKTADYTLCNDYHFEQHNKANVLGDIFDFPNRAQQWLRCFLAQNKASFEKRNLRLKKQVNWTRKDIAPVGTPLVELVNFGIERIKYANDVIGILLREARRASAEDGCPLYLMIDGVNFLWCRSTILKDFSVPDKLIEVDRLSIVNHLKRALEADWINGAIICTINPRCSWPTDRELFDPGYLLTRPGFEHMDPFIPMEVADLTRDEFEAMLSFYANHKWLTRPEAFTKAGKDQLAFMCDRNMRELFSIVSEW